MTEVGVPPKPPALDEVSVQAKGYQARVLLTELVRARSPNPPGDERGVADVIKRAAARLGLPAPERHGPRPQRPNLLLTLGHGTPRLILAAHMDTMPAGPPDAWDGDPFALLEQGARLIGLGVADMKASIATTLVAAGELAARPPRQGTVTLLFTADEEGGSAEGMGWLCEQGLISGDAAVMTEPSSVSSDSWDALYVAQRGSCVVRVVAHGRPGHSGDGVDPRERAGTAFALALSALLEADVFPGIVHPVDGTPPLVNVATMVRGGEVPYAHPGELEAIVEVRTISGMSERDVHTGLRTVIARAGLGDRVTIERGPQPSWIPGGATVVDDRLLGAARAAWSEVIGSPPREKVYPATTDSSHLDVLGIPALPAFGPGSLAVAHRPNEHVSARDLGRAVELFERLVRHYLSD